MTYPMTRSRCARITQFEQNFRVMKVMIGVFHKILITHLPHKKSIFIVKDKLDECEKFSVEESFSVDIQPWEIQSSGLIQQIYDAYMQHTVDVTEFPDWELYMARVKRV